MGAASGFEFGPFRLDPAGRVLWRGPEIVPLPPKALDVLLALVERNGEVVRKDELLDRVWPDTFVEEANLSVQVAVLRKTLGRTGDGGDYVETQPKRGYRFAAPLRRIGARHLAVLPFRLLGPGEEYLGAGLADALITRLAGVGSLVVRPTSSVLRFAGADPRAAGADLHADAVLDGRVQREGERLRVTVQLVPVSAGEAGWAGAFEAGPAGLFEVQDQLAEQVARALLPQLGAEDARRLAHRPARDAAAYHAYLEGRYLWSRFTAESILQAISCFQRAAEGDPSFALPHAGLADAQLVLGFTGALAPAEAWPLAAEAARRALRLDESVAGAHVSLAYVSLFQDWDWAAAEQELSRAVALEPQAAATHQWLALFRLMAGRAAEAAKDLALARELDPLSLVVRALEGLRLRLQGRHADELLACRAAATLDPHQFLPQWSLGLACLHNGLAAEAVAAHRHAVELTGGMGFASAVLARTLAVAGETGEARALLAGLEQVSPYQRATVELALGEREAALQSLERACGERDPWVVWLGVDPMLDPLRAEPSFLTLLARVGTAGRHSGPLGR